MLAQLEEAVVEGAGHVEAAIAVDEAAVAEGHLDRALGDVVAVEVGDAFVRQAHVSDPR